MIKKWLESPITWGGYCKLCGICWAVTMLYCAILYTVLGWIDPIGWIKGKMNKEETED